MTQSPNDTVVMAGSNGVIVDASGNRWTISPQSTVEINGLFAGFTAGVTQIAYVNGVVWQENTAGNWYSWTGSGWSQPITTSPLPDIHEEILSDVVAIENALSAESATLKTYLAKQFAAVDQQLVQIIKILTTYHITAAAPTFSPDPTPPTKTGP